MAARKVARVRESLYERVEVAAAAEDFEVDELVDHALRSWVESWERGTEFVSDDDEGSDEEGDGEEDTDDR